MSDDGLNPDEAVRAVRLSVERSGEMPDSTNYIEHTPGDSDNTKLPVITIDPINHARITDFNTDQVGFVTDAVGNRVGRVFNAEYRLDLQLDVWTAEGSTHNAREIGNSLYRVLYQHSSKGPNQPLKGEDGNPIDAVWKLRVGDGQPADDLSGSPALRRWRQDLSLWAFHKFDTTMDYMSGVSYPSDLSTDDDGTLTT